MVDRGLKEQARLRLTQRGLSDRFMFGHSNDTHVGHVSDVMADFGLMCIEAALGSLKWRADGKTEPPALIMPTYAEIADAIQASMAKNPLSRKEESR